jgi:hypothetical protein
VDIKTDTTPNEILGFDYTIKSWKFPPMFFGFFNDKGEGNIAVIKKMIEMVKKEKVSRKKFQSEQEYLARKARRESKARREMSKQ